MTFFIRQLFCLVAVAIRPPFASPLDWIKMLSSRCNIMEIALPHMKGGGVEDNREERVLESNHLAQDNYLK